MHWAEKNQPPGTLPIRTTEATTWPVSLQTLREHAVAGPCDDDELKRYLRVAVDFVQQRYGIQVMEAEYTWEMPCWSHRFWVPYPPMIGITSWEYRDPETGDYTAWDPTTTTYIKMPKDGSFATIQILDDVTLPPTKDAPDSVRIVYRAGWGTEPDHVMPCVQEAVLLAATHFLEVRTPVLTGPNSKQIELSLDAVMAAVTYGSYAGQWSHGR